MFVCIMNHVYCLILIKFHIWWVYLVIYVTNFHVRFVFPLPSPNMWLSLKPLKNKWSFTILEGVQGHLIISPVSEFSRANSINIFTPTIYSTNLLLYGIQLLSIFHNKIWSWYKISKQAFNNIQKIRTHNSFFIHNICYWSTPSVVENFNILASARI